MLAEMEKGGFWMYNGILLWCAGTFTLLADGCKDTSKQTKHDEEMASIWKENEAWHTLAVEQSCQDHYTGPKSLMSIWHDFIGDW